MSVDQQIRERLSAIEQRIAEGRTHDKRAQLYWLWALLGAVLIGVSLPVFLICLSCGERGVFSEFKDTFIRDEAWRKIAADWLTLQCDALLICGPGAAILGFWLYSLCKRTAALSGSMRKVMWSGTALGPLIAFLNLPCYYGAILMESQTRIGPRLLLLFVIAGATSGTWIAWQAWRSERLEERFLPRFSLATMMIVVFAWGGLLAVFAPK